MQLGGLLVEYRGHSGGVDLIFLTGKCVFTIHVYVYYEKAVRFSRNLISPSRVTEVSLVATAAAAPSGRIVLRGWRQLRAKIY